MHYSSKLCKRVNSGPGDSVKHYRTPASGSWLATTTGILATLHPARNESVSARRFKNERKKGLSGCRFFGEPPTHSHVSVTRFSQLGRREVKLHPPLRANPASLLPEYWVKI